MTTSEDIRANREGLKADLREDRKGISKVRASDVLGQPATKQEDRILHVPKLQVRNRPRDPGLWSKPSISSSPGLSMRVTKY